MTEAQEEYTETGVQVIDKRIRVEPEIKPTGDIVMVALQKGYDPAFIEKMMDLAERNRKDVAQQAFYEAFAAFKAVAPKVKKDKYNSFFKSNYTSLGNLLDTYNPVLGQFGLSLQFPSPQQSDKNMTVECKLNHRLGHSETVSMTGPIDAAAIGKHSGQASRNPLQDLKSTFTYLRSATCEAILGVAGTEGTLDDDGNAAGGSEPTKLEQWEILCNEAGEAAKSVDDMVKWWTNNGPAVKKELKKGEAAKIYDLFIGHKKKFDREPGSDDE